MFVLMFFLSSCKDTSSSNVQRINNEVSKLSLKDEYELNERCGKRAADVFKKDWGNDAISNDKDSSTLANYSNHYNKKLNKCFYLINSSTVNYSSKITYNFKTLIDINDNSVYGDYIDDGVKITANVQGKKLTSNNDWNLHTNTFMNE